MTTNPASGAHNSEEDSHEDVLELVLWHQMSTLTAHELVHLGNNIKTVAAWISNNVIPLSAARREDDTTDWYFPLLFQSGEYTRRSCTWSWSGVHHSSGAESGEIHSLFSLAHLPKWISNSSLPRHDIIAGAGGLLLIKLQTRECRNPTKVLELVRREFQTRLFRFSHAAVATTSQNWKPLLVSNPLTREWRVLPAADCGDVGVTTWNYRGLRAHMVVDDKANSYKVILTFRNYVCVYNSTSNSWACRAFPGPRPWGFIGIFAWGYVGASAYVGGRLYFADLEVRGSVLPVYVDDIDIHRSGYVRVFEIDEETGTCQPPIRYSLQNFFLQYPDRDHGFRVGSYAFEIVECMGSMYAVIPAKLEVLPTVLEIILTYDGDIRKYFGLMPLQFHILQLRGGVGLAHGTLRIQIPGTQFAGQEFEDVRNSLGEKLYRNPYQSLFHKSSWFRCTARGSVIWVTWDEYLLQYDVVSGQSSTRILSHNSFADALDFPYRPSFGMKP